MNGGVTLLGPTVRGVLLSNVRRKIKGELQCQVKLCVFIQFLEEVKLNPDSGAANHARLSCTMEVGSGPWRICKIVFPKVLS